MCVYMFVVHMVLIILGPKSVYTVTLWRLVIVIGT